MKAEAVATKQRLVGKAFHQGLRGQPSARKVDQGRKADSSCAKATCQHLAELSPAPWKERPSPGLGQVDPGPNPGPHRPAGHILSLKFGFLICNAPTPQGCPEAQRPKAPGARLLEDRSGDLALLAQQGQTPDGQTGRLDNHMSPDLFLFSGTCPRLRLPVA